MEHNKIFVILDHFLPFYPPNNPENQNFKKWQNVEILSFYTCMVPEIWSTKVRFFFFDMYHKWKSYDVWFLWCGAWQSEFFVILGHFLPYYSFPNNLENQTQYQSPFLLGGQLSVPNFEKGASEEKMSAWGDLKSSCHGYLPWGLTMFLV